MVHDLPNRVGTFISFTIRFESRQGNTQTVTLKHGIKPGSPGLKLNMLPSNLPLAGSPDLKLNMLPSNLPLAGSPGLKLNMLPSNLPLAGADKSCAAKAIESAGLTRSHVCDFVNLSLQVILAFGNYMNSQRRGGAYGFRLQSLDILTDAKSTDKKMTLLHYIAATVQVNCQIRFLQGYIPDIEP